MYRAVRQCLPLGVLFWLILVLGCHDPSLKDSDFSYATQPIAIYNSYWSVIPLPNNLLNPVIQYQMGALAEEQTKMGLPITTEESVAVAAALGLPLEVDNELTVDLKTGMNELDGFIPGYVIDIPLSQKIDPASIVPFDGTNADVANLFFLDAGILEGPEDLANPEIVPIMPDTYYYLFNWRRDEGVPVYKLTLRNKPSGSLAPKDMDTGHTYIVAMTGLTETGVKGENGTPVWPDSYYCLFNQEESYLREEDGLPMLNIVSEPETGTKEEKEAAVAAQVAQIEGARALTNVAVKVWEGIMEQAGTGRQRDELATTFHFTIATNPVAMFLNPINFVMAKDTILTTPADQLTSAGEIKKADACPVANIGFMASAPLDKTTLTKETIKLFKVVEEGETYEEIAVTASCDETCTQIRIVPESNLEASSTYVVAVSENLLGATNGRHTVDQSYFGLVRGKLPILTDKVTDENAPFLEKLGSPFLDNRIDTLITLDGLYGGIDDISEDKDHPVYEVTEDGLTAAGESLLGILGHIQAIQEMYAPHITYLVDTAKFAESRATLPLVWVFTTAANGAECNSFEAK